MHGCPTSRRRTWGSSAFRSASVFRSCAQSRIAGDTHQPERTHTVSRKRVSRVAYRRKLDTRHAIRDTLLDYFFGSRMSSIRLIGALQVQLRRTIAPPLASRANLAAQRHERRRGARDFASSDSGARGMPNCRRRPATCAALAAGGFSLRSIGREVVVLQLATDTASIRLAARRSPTRRRAAGRRACRPASRRRAVSSRAPRPRAGGSGARRRAPSLSTRVCALPMRVIMPPASMRAAISGRIRYVGVVNTLSLRKLHRLRLPRLAAARRTPGRVWLPDLYCTVPPPIIVADVTRLGRPLADGAVVDLLEHRRCPRPDASPRAGDVAHHARDVLEAERRRLHRIGVADRFALRAVAAERRCSPRSGTTESCPASRAHCSSVGRSVVGRARAGDRLVAPHDRVLVVRPDARDDVLERDVVLGLRDVVEARVVHDARAVPHLVHPRRAAHAVGRIRRAADLVVLQAEVWPISCATTNSSSRPISESGNGIVRARGSSCAACVKYQSLHQVRSGCGRCATSR